MDLKQLAVDTAWTSLAATASTTAAAAACGYAEDRRAAAPLNAVSHILWGDEAGRHSDLSLRYTLPGVALNTAAITGWAAIHQLLQSRQSGKHSLWRAVGSGALVSALAYAVDYYVVPKRVTPGFELRLSGRSLLCIYAALAAGLAAGSRCASRNDR